MSRYDSPRTSAISGTPLLQKPERSGPDRHQRPAPTARRRARASALACQPKPVAFDPADPAVVAQIDAAVKSDGGCRRGRRGEGALGDDEGQGLHLPHRRRPAGRLRRHPAPVPGHLLDASEAAHGDRLEPGPAALARRRRRDRRRRGDVHRQGRVHLRAGGPRGHYRLRPQQRGVACRALPPVGRQVPGSPSWRREP